MKRLFAVLFAFACVCAAPLSAEIIETNSFETLKNYVKKDTLVLLDIDNTLLQPVQELGTDQWFHHRIDHHIDQGMENGKALELALSEWIAVQSITEVEAVEKNTPDIVKQLQDEGYTVMGLTTRGLGMSTRTIEQLGRIDIDLLTTAPTRREIHFMNNRGVLFRGGVLFTAATHKGKALMRFLDRIDYNPKNIVFINDKASHITEVADACTRRDIPFVGLRYGYLDEKVNKFRADLTNLQLESFGKILSDKEALQSLEMSKS